MPRHPDLRRRALAACRRCWVGLAVVAAGLALAAPDFDRLLSLAQSRYGSSGVNAVQAWQRMLADTADADEAEQLRRVNEFFNRRLRFDDDLPIWGEADYWATPLESLGRGAGDCEDFAIAKYVSLRQLGISAERLRLIYVRAQIGGPTSRISQAHMVLGYYASAEAEPLILDNLIGEIRPASRRADLFPVFSFNSAGLWVGGAAASSADPTARLSRWRDVLERMRNEGLQ
ncbi:transglutaminase-like cysteine peptidase [Pseudothauera lacus]|uniref:Transglutaminase n=1 Tax=Pseudothauera lacus TaxID=2136175 RepID=A0A2T4IBM4_9RHOO|nr:transglutaminase-like cysteine peptidase [Pseudothauera lacus]PTD95163.1 transglutaminase [Pseudothauera lacus]